MTTTMPSTSSWDFDYYLEEDCSMTFQGVIPNKPKHTFNPELKSFMDSYIDDTFMCDDYNYEHYEKWGFIKPHFELFEDFLVDEFDNIVEKFSSEIDALQTGIIYWIVIPKNKKEQKNEGT